MYVQTCLHAFTTSFSFSVRRSGTAPLGISTASLVLWYLMALCWVSAEHAGNTMVVVEGLGKPAGTSPFAEGCTGFCVWKLQSFATREGVLPPPSWERHAEALFASLERHYTLLINICCCCWKVIKFDESEETELQFCRTWGIGSSSFFFPWNSQLSLFDTRSCWYSYSCRIMTCYVADYVTVNVYYIFVYSRVWDVPWRSNYMWVSLNPWGEDVCACVCVYVETAVCSAFFLTYWLL